MGAKGQKDTPICKFCDQHATFAAAQSVDRGKNTYWMFICAGHADGWNEGGDWDAPIYELVPAPDVGNYDGPV